MKNVKYVGMVNGRECYELTVRIGHEAEAIAEMVKVQENMRGKQRFKVFFEDSSEQAALDFNLAWKVHNRLRNIFIRKDYQVKLESSKFIQV